MLGLGLHFLRFDELAPRMRPAAEAFDAFLRGHSVVAGIVVGHQVAAITIEQAQRHFLRAAGGVVEKDHRFIRRPFVKGNKNDFVDAEAICEAASRPSMRFVSPKTEAQQTLSVLHRLRESLVRDRTKTANQMHGFLLEFGISLPRGLAIMKRLSSVLAEHELPVRLTVLLQRHLWSAYRSPGR